jgi:hypothetical protein
MRCETNSVRTGAWHPARMAGSVVSLLDRGWRVTLDRRSAVEDHLPPHYERCISRSKKRGSRRLEQEPLSVEPHLKIKMLTYGLR